MTLLMLPVQGLLVFSSLVSHHLRDASRRGLWVWPGLSLPLPPPAYLLATQLLPPAVRALHTRWDTRPPAVMYSALTHV